LTARALGLGEIDSRAGERRELLLFARELISREIEDDEVYQAKFTRAFLGCVAVDVPTRAWRPIVPA